MKTTLKCKNKRFPLDMLRYDECWPATQRDVELINHNIIDGRDNESYEISVCSTKPLTLARWQSFGWHKTTPKQIDKQRDELNTAELSRIEKCGEVDAKDVRAVKAIMAEWGRKGGQSTSKAKIKAARANGKKHKG